MRFVLPIVLLLIGSEAFAQVGRDTGEVTGWVYTSTGQPVSGVSVALRDAARGLDLSTNTDESGFYRFAGLRPGTYDLQTSVTSGDEAVQLQVRIGETTAAPRLIARPGNEAPTFYVDATAERPKVDPERTHQAAFIGSRELMNLPVNRRNYLDLALLTPGANTSNGLPDDIDLQVASNPSSGLSFNGNNGRFNTVALDGIENNYNSGSVRPAVSQEGIEEFQVNRTGYTVETGWATGGAVNIITKSGTNAWHGTAFGLLRHTSLQASNSFDPVKSPFTRTQVGGSLGGPLRRDRVFLFTAFERLQRRETAFVPIFRDRFLFDTLPQPQTQLITSLQNLGGPFAQLGGVLNAVLVPSNNAATMSLFAKNSGEFPFKEDSTTGLVRADIQFSDRNTLAIRGNVTADSADNSNFGSLIAVSRGRRFELLDHSLAGNAVIVHSPTSMSQIRAGYGAYSFDVVPLEPFGPELTIYGYGFFNRDVFLPAMATEHRTFLQYTFTRFAGKHVWKAGGEFNPVRHGAGADVPFGGRFFFSEGIPLGAVLNAVAGDPNAATSLAGVLAGTGQAQVAGTLASSITSLQAFNLGLPTLYTQTFGSPDWVGWFRRSAGWVQDSVRVRPNLQLTLGLRYEIEGKNDPFSADRNNLAGRFGFAWRPSTSGSTVVRGGYGMYYGVILNSLAYLADQFRKLDTVVIPITGVPGVVNPSTQAPVTSVDVYNGLRASGVLGQTYVSAADLAPFGIRPGPGLPFAVLFDVDSDFQNPLSHQASLEIERSFGGFTASLAGVFVRGLRAPMSLDRNVYRAGTQPDGLPVFGLVDPRILQRNVFESSANSTYRGLTVGVARRAASGVTLNAHYTWSNAKDSTTDFATDYQPMDQTNVSAEWALSAFHVAHRFVGSAVLESPVRPGYGGALDAIIRNWLLAPIVTIQSGRPFNLLSGYDNLGDGHPSTKRPIGLGRNAGQGPGYFSADLRLSRRFRLPGRENFSLEAIGEGFNLSNRTNFRTVNNIVGSLPLSALPDPLQGSRGLTSTPLAFTSAHDARQFQIGLRLRY